MKYLAMNPFKDLIRKFCQELEKSAIKFADSKEFKKSIYNDLTADQLLDTIMQEDREDVRAVLVCLLHYKLNERFYQSSAEKQHFKRFKGE
jgi:hypothetical protein